MAGIASGTENTKIIETICVVAQLHFQLSQAIKISVVNEFGFEDRKWGFRNGIGTPVAL